MAIYTTPLWDVIETHGKGFLANYPLFDEGHRETLNELIVDSYMNREIAHESVPLFFLAFKNHMRLNMPVFNKLYQSELIEFDPLVTMRLETKSENVSAGKTKSDSISENNSDTEGTGLSVAYGFPQTRLSDRKDYATSAGDSETSTNVAASGTETSTSENEGTASGNSVTLGYQGVPSDLIAAFRDSIINVDAMVVLSLEPLFMGVWGTNSRLIGYN